MSSLPFLAQIEMFSFGYAIQGSALCNGQLLPINQNQALFSLLGTTYGGNGQTTFALPNLQGRVPMHLGNGHNLGEAGGSTAVTISASQMPTHLHVVTADDANADAAQIGGARFAGSNNLYRAPSALTALVPTVISNVGGSQAHNNMSPYLVINFMIALQGEFPSQN